MCKKNGETMEKMQLNETFSGEVTYLDREAMCESSDFSSLIDGENIIGMVEGQFFQPDGMSRNHRWYSRKLWENALNSADVKNRLLNRTMYGEIGHSDGPVTDMTLRDGNVSHIIVDLWIDEKGRGMGKALILDTPKGRLLKTYLGAKSKLKVSTRGEGVYLDGETKDGHPIIDPDTYELQTVDFVLNPGFLETSAKLTTQKEDFTPETKQVEITQTKEGENGMDAEKYIQKLEAKVEALEAKNESLSEELKSKEKELLESKFVESAEIKKINEAYAPFKKMGVSAKTLNETLKRTQDSLQKANTQNVKLTEELNAYKEKCGSIEQVDEALEMSEKALATIAEYRELGTVSELKELMAKSEAMIPQLEELSILAEYRDLGSVEDLKTLAEKCEQSLPKLKEFPALEALVEEYKSLGSPEDIKDLSAKCESLLPKLEQLEEAKKLAKNVEKIMPKLEEMKQLEAVALKAKKVIKEYMETVGSIKQAKALVESRKETIKKVNVKEALETSKKFGCTVESAAKMIKKFGVEETHKLLEEEIAKREPKETEKLAESVELVEEAKELDAVNAKPESKDAKDFVKSGMIVNGFNQEALGKKINTEDLNKIDGLKVEGENDAKALLNKLKGVEPEVEEAPAVEPEKDPEEAEKIADKLLK